jgi:hypothetical protein
MIPVGTHGAGDQPDDCPPLPELPCLFDPEWPDLPWKVVLAYSVMVC